MEPNNVPHLPVTKLTASLTEVQAIEACLRVEGAFPNVIQGLGHHLLATTKDKNLRFGHANAVDATCPTATRSHFADRPRSFLSLIHI